MIREKNSNKRRSRWRRVLWQKQPFPDNYMPAEQLVSVVMKGPRHTLTYLQIVSTALHITQAISLTTILLCAYQALKKNLMNPMDLFYSQIVLYISILLWDVLDRFVLKTRSIQRIINEYFILGEMFNGIHMYRVRNSWGNELDKSPLDINLNRSEFPMVDELRSYVFVVGKSFLQILCGYMLLFVLTMKTTLVVTLSSHISIDSAYNAVGIILVAHLLILDYRKPLYKVNSESLALSLNGKAMSLGIAASILLASRLPSQLSSFCFLGLSLFIFAVIPIVRVHFICVAPKVWNIVVTPIMCYAAFDRLTLVNDSQIVIDILWFILIVTAFVMPAWYHRLQHRQITIKGPWDIPILKKSSPKRR